MASNTDLKTIGEILHNGIIGLISFFFFHLTAAVRRLWITFTKHTLLAKSTIHGMTRVSYNIPRFLINGDYLC